jgi:hypothetical protein
VAKTLKHQTEIKKLFDEYIQEKSATTLIRYLEDNSSLPGRRANLELAKAFTNVVEELSTNHHASLTELINGFCSINSIDAPTNTSKEFIPFCGTWALGIVGCKDEQNFKHSMVMLNRMAKDSSQILDEWIKMESWLVYRAIAAGLASPSTLQDRTIAIKALDLHKKVLETILSNPNNRNEDFKILRKGLAYTLSVIIVEVPDEGFTYLKSLTKTQDKDIRWIIKENMKKNRLVKAYKAEVQQVQALLKSN